MSITGTIFTHELLLESGKSHNSDCSDKMQVRDCIFNILDDHIIRKILDEVDSFEYKVNYIRDQEKQINEEKVTKMLELEKEFFKAWGLRIYRHWANW